MQKHKTQQFARFYLKDSKTKNSKFNNEKLDVNEFNFSSEPN